MYESVTKLPCGEVTVAKLPCGEVTGNRLVSGIAKSCTSTRTALASELRAQGPLGVQVS